MIRIIRGAFSATVKCDCGFRQTANTEPQADVIVKQHTCQRPTSRRRNSTSNRA
jgi:hypothetical protein